MKNEKLFKVLIKAAVSLYNEIHGTKFVYDDRDNKVSMNNIKVKATECLRETLINESRISFNSMLSANGHTGH